VRVAHRGLIFGLRHGLARGGEVILKKYRVDVSSGFRRGILDHSNPSTAPAVTLGFGRAPMNSATPKEDHTARTRLFGGNRMKLGVMAFNCSHGLTITTVPEA
jgi:hypothetical protein